MSINAVVDVKPFKTMWKIKGGKIHATVKKELVSRFSPFLIQGESLMLISFSVTHSCGFEPVKYTEVLDGTLNPDYLVDVIGQIVEISHIEHINVNGKEAEKVSLELRNSDDERLPMVLWGKFTSDVSEAMQVRDEHSTVLVLRFAKIKKKEV
ncbi:hypothetical protein F2Q69_00050335 [Brassica cretica]|uniref:Replication protein A OB domain-containing protein n=1 Tax=Brassica cretica TaxID=69181 RepID=A0A8S9PQG1_BRACR|nr:hypothetical protein F2Q69_00050335 [Brassica cretica]